ncbi:hypothetical protein [Mesorhizobium sanjuanii]|uniref:hypothetical protein n=1 Tax=Mesorhizobium sanjuanii TaxID=2037900 RepID=UPI001AD8197E|nr:hypothetical protein [Mesorhizobium sanjuanii]
MPQLLPPNEADQLRPFAATTLAPDYALLGWFEPVAAVFIRSIECHIRCSLE